MQLIGEIGILESRGVAGLTKAVAWEYAQAGIRINAVCPGTIDTPLLGAGTTPELEAQYVAGQAIKRLGRPEEIANAVAWLCSDEASFVTGVPMPVDAGYVAIYPVLFRDPAAPGSRRAEVYRCTQRGCRTGQWRKPSQSQ